MIRASSPMRNSAGQTRLPTFSTISRSISSSGIDGQRRADHVRVEVALAAEAAAGVELRRPGRAGARAGRRRASPARRPPARRRAGRRCRRAGRARAASSCRRPGALMRLTHRHAVAVEVVAVGPRDRVVGVERVLDDPDLHAMHASSSSTSIDSTSSSSPVSTSTSAPAQAGQRNAGQLDLPLALARARSAAAPGRPPARAARPRTTVSRATIPKRTPASRARPGAGARRARCTTRHAPPAGVPHGGVDDGGGDRELVHQAW